MDGFCGVFGIDLWRMDLLLWVRLSLVLGMDGVVTGGVFGVVMHARARTGSALGSL